MPLTRPIPTLQGLFDASNGGYVPQHDRLLQGISRQLWPLLGISAPVADALWAWVHFREVRIQCRQSTATLPAARDATHSLPHPILAQKPAEHMAAKGVTVRVTHGCTKVHQAPCTESSQQLRRGRRLSCTWDTVI